EGEVALEEADGGFGKTCGCAGLAQGGQFNGPRWSGAVHAVGDRTGPRGRATAVAAFGSRLPGGSVRTRPSARVPGQRTGLDSPSGPAPGCPASTGRLRWRRCRTP